MEEPNKATLNRHMIDILFKRDEIAARVAELGEQISADYAGRTPVLVGALKGCFVFMADLARQITVPLELEFISAASYRDGAKQDDTIAVGPSPYLPIRGRDVIVVEGVVDSGRTAEAILRRLKLEEPKSLELATLIYKKEVCKKDLIPKYVGFEIKDEFVIGYGLDYSQLYRNLNFVGVVSGFDK